MSTIFFINRGDRKSARVVDMDAIDSFRDAVKCKSEFVLRINWFLADYGHLSKVVSLCHTETVDPGKQ